MPEYLIRHWCGHSEAHNVYGSPESHQRRVRNLYFRVCTKCFHEELAAKRTADAEFALRHAEIHGLPHLRGSEAQIAWAATIRYKMYRDLDDGIYLLLMTREVLAGASDATRARIEALPQRSTVHMVYLCQDVKPLWLEWIASKTEASYWINAADRLARVASYRLAEPFSQMLIARIEAEPNIAQPKVCSPRVAYYA